MGELDDLERKLVARAAVSASVEDISAVATALKTIAEVRNAATPDITQRRAYTLELIKALSALFVPIVSLLALAGTILVQTQQVVATRQQTENSEWRELLSSVKGEPGQFAVNDVTIAPRLMSFASSERYGRQATVVTIRIMGHLWNVDGFQDLFSFVFPKVTAQNLPDILAVDRALLSTRRRQEDHCSDIVAQYQEDDPNGILKACSYSLIDKNFDNLNIVNKPVKDEIAKVRPVETSLLWESFYLTQKLMPYLHAANGQAGPASSKLPADLSNLWFQDADFSNLDLSQSDITGSLFATVRFDNANLNFPHLPFGVVFDGANWWDAQVIGRELLEWFVHNRPKEATDHIDQVHRLCGQAHATCD